MLVLYIILVIKLLSTKMFNANDESSMVTVAYFKRIEVVISLGPNLTKGYLKFIESNDLIIESINHFVRLCTTL